MRGVVGGLTPPPVDHTRPDHTGLDRTGPDLRELAAIGPAFTLSPLDGDTSWRALDDLVGNAVLLRAHVEHFRDRLGVTEDRVAASWVVTGIAARVIAPTLALAAVHGRALPVGSLHWRPWTGGLLPLAAPPVPDAPVDPDSLVDTLLEPLLTLVGGLRAGTRVSARLLAGEIAAAVAKVAVVVARERPAAAATAHGLAAALLRRPPLTGLAGVAGGVVARRTCCLAYRVPGGRTCTDCVLGRARPGTDVRSPVRPRSPR